MYEGVSVTIGGKEFIVPPLNFRQLRGFKAKLEKIQAAGESSALSEDQMEAMIEIIHAAMTRNYPDLTIDDLQEMIDLGNMGRVFSAVMNASGLVKRQGEAEPGTGKI